jgi:hypothetical protein
VPVQIVSLGVDADGERANVVRAIDDPVVTESDSSSDRDVLELPEKGARLACLTESTCGSQKREAYRHPWLNPVPARHEDPPSSVMRMKMRAV